MEYCLSKFKNGIANQFGHNVFYNNVLIRVFYYLLEKRINTRILFLMTTYCRVLVGTMNVVDKIVCYVAHRCLNSDFLYSSSESDSPQQSLDKILVSLGRNGHRLSHRLWQH